jgi:hypothetical protein
MSYEQTDREYQAAALEAEEEEAHFTIAHMREAYECGVIVGRVEHLCKEMDYEMKVSGFKRIAEIMARRPF